MKKINRWEFLTIALLSVLLVACGSGGGEGDAVYTPPADNAPPNNEVLSEPIVLVSSKLLEDNRWRYSLTIDSAAIPGSKASPFCMGQHNGWRVESITDENIDGKYEVEIITFNREMKVNFGGDFLADSWMYTKLSKYFILGEDGSQNLIVGFYEGNIYRKGEIVFPPEPGLMGDEFLRFTPEDNQLLVYVNNNKLNDIIDEPFVLGNFTNSLPVNQTITDSSGWGYIIIPVTSYPVKLIFGYGGNFKADRWVSPNNSFFYDLATNNFHVYVSKNSASPGARF